MSGDGPDRDEDGRGGPERPPSLADALRYLQISTVLTVPMLGLGALGYVLDRRFATAPWLLLAGLLLGMAGGFVNFLRLVLRPRPPGGGKGS